MNDPFPSLLAIALHHHFKTSHVNKCTAISCLWSSSISRAPLLPDIPFLLPCLEVQEGLGGCSVGKTTGLFCSLKCPPDEVPFINISAPHLSKNFLSPDSIRPLSKILKAEGDSGDKKAGCSHVSLLRQIPCSDSAW